MWSTASSSRCRSWETMSTAPSKPSIRCSSAARRRMSRWASGSSSMSTSGAPGSARRRSATSLRWPPESSRGGHAQRRVGQAEGRPARLRASLSSRSPPCSLQAPRQALLVGQHAAHGGEGRGPARGRPGAARTAAISASSSASSGPRRARTVATGSRSSPATSCASMATTSPRRRVTVPPSGWSSPDRAGAAAWTWPPPLGPRHADARRRRPRRGRARRGSCGRRRT